MASSYPGSLDSFTSKTDKEDIYEAAHINDLQNAVVATQTELGTDPAGSATDLKTRLAVNMADNGTVRQGTAFPGSPSEGQFFWNTDSKLFYIYDATAAEWKLLSGVPTSYVTSSTSRLYIPGKGVNSGTSVIDVGSGKHTITVNNATITTSQYKFADSSIDFNGSSAYLSLASHADFNVPDNAGEDVTVSLFVRHDDHVGTESYIARYVDANNYWFLNHIHGSGVNFTVIDGGSTEQSLTGGEITDSNWHHVALVRVTAATAKWGLYVDGTQVAYQATNSTSTTNAALEIGRIQTGSYFDGQLEQIQIDDSNVFSASPNSSLADTITVPTSEATPTTGGDGQSEVIHLSSGAIKRWINR